MNPLSLLSLLGALVTVAIAATPLPCFAAQPSMAKASGQSDVQPALDALQQLLSAHAAGNQKQMDTLVDPTMIGYSRVVDPVRDAAVVQKQLHVTLSDTRTQVSEDVVIIQTHWEKRFISTPGRRPSRRSGTCTFVMRPDASLWRLSALNGDNPFGTE